MSLKIKFFIPVFVLITTVMVITIVFSYRGTKDSIETLLYKQIEMQADTTESLVSSWVERNMTDIETVSRSGEVKNFLLGKRGINTKNYASETIKRIARSHRFYELIALYDNKGEMVLSNRKEFINFNASQTPYFSKNSKGFSLVSGIFPSSFSNKPIFVISAPVFMGNRILGSIVSYIKIADFVESFIDKVKIGEFGKTYIFDSNGQTLSYNDKTKLVNIASPEIGLEKITEQHNFGIFKHKVNNSERIVVTKKIGNFGWGIAISVIENEFMKALDYHREFIIVLCFWMSVIMGAGIWYMIMHLLVKPIDKILLHISEIDVDEDSLKKELSVSSNDEFGKLKKSFNRMTQKLNQTLLNLKKEVQEKKLAEEALMAERDNSSNIIYNSPNIICEIAPDGSIIFINPTGLRLTGYSNKEILGRNWWQILATKNEQKQFENLMALLEDQNINDYEMTISSRKGETYTISWTYIKKFDDDGNLISTIGIGNDISRRKVVEKELKKAHDELEKRVHERTRELVLANEAASESAKAKSEFLANMSHEIRTPMNAIMGMCDLVLETSLSRKQKNFIKIIRSSSRSLLELINDILDFSKIDAGKLVFENLKFNLRDIIEEVTDMYLDKSLEKEIELIVDINPDVPREVYADPLRLRQILVNLITNAFKFTSEGEICISVCKKYHKDDRAGIEFCVRDTGIGIKKNLSRKLFDVFAQADGSTTRQYGGTGLGLAICKKIVDQMGGDIWIESEYGVGSSFFFSVELKVSYSGDLERNKAPNELKKLKVLIVEDNPSTLMVLKRFIESFGFKSALAKSGEDAIEMFKKAPDGEFGLVLMDVKLPGIDGIAASKIIKRSKKKSPPIILISTLGNNIEKAKQIGIDSYLIKPIKQSLLFDTIMQIFGYQPRINTGKTKEEIRTDEFNNMKVLLVEDNAINQMVATEMLLTAGISVDKASTGLQAIEMIQEFRDYDAVLMDIQMPEMDGIEATKIIRKKMSFKNIPIIAMTAHAMYGDRERCFQAGMDDYVPKPIDQKELFNALRKNVLKIDEESEDSFKDDTENSDYKDYPELNVNDGIRRIGGNIKVYSGIVNEFCNTFDKFSDKFEDYLSEKSFEDARIFAHSLKGAAGNISADGLFYTAKLLEKACVNEDKDYIRNIIPEIEDQLKEIKKASRELISETDDEKEKQSSFEIIDIVKNLSRSLDQSDPIESDNHLKELRSYVLHNVYDADILLLEKKLAASVDNYDYENAKKFLNDFSTSLNR